jgi:predicted ATPase
LSGSAHDFSRRDFSRCLRADVVENRRGQKNTTHFQTEFFLAHHYSQAGLVDLAIEFWGRAGARSAYRSAHHEAVGHFGSALDLVGKLPPSHQRDERELELMLALAVSLIAVHGFGSIRVEECAVRAKALSDKLHGSQNRFAAERSRLLRLLYASRNQRFGITM